jgi:WD40 repeat protein
MADILRRARVILFSILSFVVLTSSGDRLRGDTLPEGAVARLGTLHFRSAGEVKAVAFAPNGTTLAVASDDGLVCLWDVPSGKELRRCPGHESGVRAVAFAPDGQSFASAGYDQTIRIWETATGKPLHTVRINRGVALALAYAPDGKTLAAAHRNRGIALIDPGAGQELRTLAGHTNWVTAVAFAPDGQTLASASRDRTVRVWKVETGEEVRRIDTSQSVHAVTFATDGKSLFAAGAAGAIREHDAVTGEDKRAFPGHKGGVAALSRGAGLIASAGNDGTVRLWDTATGKEQRAITVSTDLVPTVALSSDGRLVAAAGVGRNAVRVWETNAGKELSSTVPGHEAGITALAFSHDGRTLAAGSADRRVSLWVTDSGKLRHFAAGHEGAVHNLLFASDGRALLSVGDDRTIRLWDAGTGKEDRRFPLDNQSWALVALSFGPDGTPQAWTTMLAGGDPMNRANLAFRTGTEAMYQLNLTELAGHKHLRTFEPNLGQYQGANPNGFARMDQFARRAWPAHVGPITAVAAGHGRTLLATGSTDSTVGVWRISTGKFLGKMAGHSGRVTFVGLTNDERTIVSSGDDGTIRLWEAATRTEVLTSPAPAKLARVVTLAPDGQTLAWASTTDPTIHLWDVTSGTSKRVLPGHAHPASVLAFAPDGKRLASGCADSTILLWDLTAGDEPFQGAIAAAECDKLWTDLASDKAPPAYAAMWKLRAAPQAALAFFKDRLKPTDPGKLKPVAQLIKELDDQTFEVRRAAQDALEDYGELAEKELLRTLDGKPPLEVVRRIQELLFTLEQKRATGLAPPEELRVIRSIQALEWIATPEARAFLEMLAAGSPIVRQTQEAKAAVARLTAGVR